MRGVKNKILKQSAISLRKKGFSFPMIEAKLGIPRATLSYWFKNLVLSSSAKDRILVRKQQNLIKTRKKALVVLKQGRINEQKKLEKRISLDFENFEFDKRNKELLLVMLYLGEGFKIKSYIGLGNSNPKIALMFVKLLRDIYCIEESRLRCYLHLRMDQDYEKEILFWSNALKISKSYFGKTQFDKRTQGIKTWLGYHGVCIIYCYDARIEKRLTEIQNYLIKKILDD